MYSGVSPFLVFTCLLTVHYGQSETNFDRTVDLHSHQSVQEGLPKLEDETVLGELPPVTSTTDRVTFRDPDLPAEHYPYYFTQYPDEADICRADENCGHNVSFIHSLLHEYVTHYN